MGCVSFVIGIHRFFITVFSLVDKQVSGDCTVEERVLV